MKINFTLLLMALCTTAFAQDSLKRYNNIRNQTTATGMEVLGSWGILNLGVGAAGWATSHGGENKYFYQMTTIWGGINLALAIPGYLHAEKNEDKSFTAAESLAEQKKIERVFLVNGGLDIAYIGTGTFLKIRGDDRNSAELQGYGSSIIIEGVFLLFFDSAMYTSQRGNGNRLRRFLEKYPLTFNGRQIGFMASL
jgi:hypothetical protein